MDSSKTTLFIEMNLEYVHISVLSEDKVELLACEVKINNNQTENVLLEIESLIFSLQKIRQVEFKIDRLILLIGECSNTADRIITAIVMGIALAYEINFIKTDTVTSL